MGVRANGLVVYVDVLGTSDNPLMAHYGPPSPVALSGTIMTHKNPSSTPHSAKKDMLHTDQEWYHRVALHVSL